LAELVEFDWLALFTAFTPNTADEPPNTVTKNISLLLDTQPMLMNVSIVADQIMMPSEAKRLNRSTQKGCFRGLAIMKQ
jgi:hypothetical protein